VFGIENVPEKVKVLFYSISHDKVTLLIMMNLFLIVLGMWLDCSASIILFAPMLTPWPWKSGLTGSFRDHDDRQPQYRAPDPSLAICLFAVADISRDPLIKVIVAVLPFLVACFALWR